MELGLLINPVSSQQQAEISAEDQLWQLTYSMLFLTLSGFVLNWLYTAVNYAYDAVRKKMVC